MTSDLSTAFLVLGVGMASVFFILSIVVIGGKQLIRLVNHFSPDVPEKKIQPAPISKKQVIKPSTIAIIAAVVESVTDGKGRIEKIENS
ncbi:MAG: OadG family protein [Bacteroidota bacterium]